MRQFGSLSLSYVTLTGLLSVVGGGSLVLSGCDVRVSAAVTANGGTVSLNSCTLRTNSLDTRNGSVLTLTAMVVSAAAAADAASHLQGVGSAVHFVSVTIPVIAVDLTATVSVDADNNKVNDPPNVLGGTFVTLCPCTVSNGGNCVG